MGGAARRQQTVGLFMIKQQSGHQATPPEMVFVEQPLAQANLGAVRSGVPTYLLRYARDFRSTCISCACMCMEAGIYHISYIHTYMYISSPMV